MTSSPDVTTAQASDKRTLHHRRAQALGPAYRLFYHAPVHFVRGSGTHLFDINGVDYLDAYNNVPAVGHCHPHVVEAQHRQAARLNTHTRYLGDGLVDYAERLLATFPEPLANVMFTCTGSEAVDLALRVARYGRSGTGVIVTENAYHGTTAAAAAVSPSLGAAQPLGADVRVVPAPHRFASDEVATAFPAAVEAAASDLHRHGHGVAALLVDSIFASDGVVPGPPGFLQRAAEVVRAVGGVYIADEVQPGFGRTGEGMWGFGRHDVVPDLVVLGKPMGNGMPIAALVAKPELLARFGSEIRYFNTFGGNPVAIAAANAMLDVIESESLVSHADRIGTRLLEELRRRAGDHPRLGAVRGAGLFLGADVVDAQGRPDPAGAEFVANAYRDQHVLVGTAGQGNTVIKIRPPLVFSSADTDRFLLATDHVLAQLEHH